MQISHSMASETHQRQGQNRLGEIWQELNPSSSLHQSNGVCLAMCLSRVIIFQDYLNQVKIGLRHLCSSKKSKSGYKIFRNLILVEEGLAPVPKTLL